MSGGRRRSSASKRWRGWSGQSKRSARVAQTECRDCGRPFQPNHKGQRYCQPCHSRYVKRRAEGKKPA